MRGDILKRHWKSLIAALAIPLLAGGLAALLAGGMESFSYLVKPPLSPPGWLFPVVWTLLYLMMGFASWRVYVLSCPAGERRAALKLYAVQLAVNALWPWLFFRLGLYSVSTVWLAALLVLVLCTMGKFKRLDDLAGLLMIPYALWCAFALYLNIGITVLNR